LNVASEGLICDSRTIIGWLLVTSD
jgi:hypothetical protein